MATVYLARDLKHYRPVALKVLRADLAAILGLERFLREIRLTAALQHPHILPLLDSGEADGAVYYAMPFVEGQSLRERLRQEKQLPIAVAVRLASEVASALEYAHRRGVIHRDIKPENILLHDGQALVADFGIALAASNAGGDQRLTETGLSLGTPHYMSPEQAMGERELTGRSDIYALGAVTYELLTGDPPFTASSAQGVIARVLAENPAPPSRFRKSVPPHVDAAVLTALEKLPADRFATGAEFAGALAGGAVDAVRPRKISRRRRWLGAAIAMVSLVLAAGYGIRRMEHRSDRVGRADGVRRFSLLLPDSAPLAIGTGRPAVALTPDGTRLLYVARMRGENVVLLRDLRTDSVRMLPAGVGGTGPIVSPSGSVAGFFVGSRLIAASLTGGRARLLESVTPVTRGAVWLSDSTAGVATDPNGSVLKVPLEKPVTRESLTWLTGGPDMSPELGHAWPALLPSGKAILYAISDGGEPSTWRIAVRELPAGAERTLIEGGSHPRYVTSGHIVFVREGALWAVPFDAEHLQIRGSAVQVQPGLLTEPDGLGHYAVAGDGTLVYATGSGWQPSRRLAWVRRNGSVRPLPIPEGMYDAVALAPDGRRVAVVRADGMNRDVWVGDLARGTTVPITRDGGEDGSPVWSPNGRRLALATEQWGSPPKLAITDFSDSGLRLVADTGFRFSAPTAWATDGLRLFLTVGSVGLGPSATGSDISVYEGSREHQWLVTARDEGRAAPSPDGRWVAYVTDESGRDEVYLRKASGAGDLISASTSGGTEPRWGRATGALYFRRGDVIYVVLVPGGRAELPDLSKPRPFLQLPPGFVTEGGFNSAAWDVAPDEQGVLGIEDRRYLAVRSLHIVLDWPAVLRVLAP